MLPPNLDSILTIPVWFYLSLLTTQVKVVLLDGSSTLETGFEHASDSILQVSKQKYAINCELKPCSVYKCMGTQVFNYD